MTKDAITSWTSGSNIELIIKACLLSHVKIARENTFAESRDHLIPRERATAPEPPNCILIALKSP